MMQTSIEQILSSYDDRAPLSQASTIPAAWYVDPRIAELERLSVFSKTWQLVARTEQVKTPGQFVSTRVAGEPIVVVRGNDGALRAFYNVCRHHAAAVVTEPCGQRFALALSLSRLELRPRWLAQRHARIRRRRKFRSRAKRPCSHSSRNLGVLRLHQPRQPRRPAHRISRRPRPPHGSAGHQQTALLRPPHLRHQLQLESFRR